MTHDEMVAEIEGGGTVLWNGRIIYTVEDLPTQEEIDELLAPPSIGPQGYSAYEIAVQDGFVGTEEEWLDSLVGPTGPEGPQGDVGPAGEGSGNVNGPASSTDDHIALFDGATGTLLKDSGTTLASKQDALGYTPVPNTRTVNGHALSADVTVTKSDVSLGSVTDDAQLKAADLDTDSAFAANSDTKIPSQKAVKTAVDAKQNSLGFTAVPNTRTVNGHALSADVTVSKSDVGLSNVDNTADTAKPVSTAQQTAIDAKVSDTAYNATSWDAVTTIAPSKNAVRDKIETLAASIPVVSDTAYDATTWNANTDVPTKNAVRDKIESMGSSNGAPMFIASGNVTNNNTNYFGQSQATYSTSETSRQGVCPATGTLSNLYCRFWAAATGTGTVTATLRINGVDTAVTCNISQASANTGAIMSDLTHSVAVTAGDLISVKFVIATGDVSVAIWLKFS